MSNKRLIGRYEIQRVLGRGGMGTVYLAKDPLIDREMAIKEIHVDQAVNASERTELEARFKLEYRSAGTLSHPNIVTIYDVLEEGDSYYIAMEYVEGMSLGNRLKQQPRPPFDEVCDLARQIADGLDYAHGHDIVHRDVKPANVLLTPNGRPKITDFGLAKWRTSELTMTGTVLGTPAYMSPEQVTGQDVDGRSDQFSFAIILYLMLTGQQPFPGEHPTTIIYKIVHEQPPPPRELNDLLPPAVDRTMLRALAKKPEDRYPSCAALAADLEASLSGEQTTAPRDGAPQESPPYNLSEAGQGTVAAASDPTRPRIAATRPRIPATAGDRTDDTPATADDLTLAAPTPTPRRRRRRRRRGGGLKWLAAAIFIAGIGALGYWTSQRQQADSESAAELDVPPPPVTSGTAPAIEHVLSIETGPAGAAIRVNGKDTGLSAPGELPVKGDLGETVHVELFLDGRVVGERRLKLGRSPPEPWLEKPPAAPVRLAVTSAPEGAAIRIGGRDTGLLTPAEVELDPDPPGDGTRHVLELTLAGYDPLSWSFVLAELSDEQRTGLHFPLVSSAPPGHLTVNAPYPVSLIVDGRSHGPFTRDEVAVAPGSHTVVLVAADVFLRQTMTVEVGSGERKSVRIPRAVAVRITANPANCEVTVDKTFTDSTPITNLRMAVGTHEFTFYWPALSVRKTVRKTVSRDGQGISETPN